MSAAALMRTVGPWLPEHRIGRANLARRISGEVAAEIETILRGVWDNLGRVGAEFAHIDRLWDYDREHGRGRIMDSDETETIALRLRDDGKPALIFAAHLANWELAGGRRRTATASTRTVLYRRPNMPAVSRRRHRACAPAAWARWSRPASTRRSSSPTRCSAARTSPCWSISMHVRACR